VTEEPEVQREDDAPEIRELNDDELDDVAGGNGAAADLSFGGQS
jgi:hypothetical protein